MTAACAAVAPTSTTAFASGGAGFNTLATESISAVTDVDSACGRRSLAQPRADSKKAGSPATICSPWLIAAGTMMNARPRTVTKNVA